MLFQIRNTRVDSQPADCVDALLECHQRIRQLTALAARFADLECNHLQTIAETSEQLIRYFTHALPLHQQDEDISILPRLRSFKDPVLNDALGCMMMEHAELDSLLEPMIASWKRIRSDAFLFESHRCQLQQGSKNLMAFWEKHLTPEEAIIFPQMRLLLPRQEMEAILREMHERRQNQWLAVS